MSQTDVLILLKKNGWMLSTEIRLELSMGTGATSRILRRLLDLEFIISMPSKAVIKEKSRLKKTSPVALAYNITDSTKKYFN